MRTLMRTCACAIAALVSVHAAAADEPASNPVELRPAAEYRAELEAMLAEGQPVEGANAWDELLAACAAWKTVNEWSKGAWDPETPLSEDPRTSCDEMRFGALDLDARKPGLEFLRRLDAAGAWAALDRAASAPRCVPPVPWDADTDPAYLSEAQLASRWTMFMDSALVSAMRVAHAQGNEDEVGAHAGRLVTIAEVQCAGIDTLAHMYASRAVFKLCREVCQENQDQTWSDSLLRRVDASLSRIDPYPSSERVLRAMPIVERMFAAADPKGYADAGEEEGLPPRSVGQILDGVDAVSAEAIASLGTPVSAREEPGSKFLHAQGIGEAEAHPRLLSGAAYSTGSVDQMLVSDAWAQTLVAGTRAVIAVERYRIAHGKYPETLAAVVPAFLPSVPADPMTGGPMLYTRIENDPHGRAYLVYSTGIDGIDNGGRESEGDLHANPVGIETGFDFIVNQPRRTLD